MPQTFEELQAHLQQLELSLLQPDRRKSALVTELLADDFVEFGSSGRVFDKRQIIEDLREEAMVERTASGFVMKLLTPEIALLTYRVCRHVDPVVTTLRSSIWRQTRTGWQIVFHQGTPIPTE